MQKVLILGATGMLGSAVERIMLTSKDLEVFSTSRELDKSHKFDAKKDSIDKLLDDVQPNWIINCIGIIKPRIDEKSISSLENAIEINSEFPIRLALKAENLNIKVIQIATDCVFSGKIGRYTESSKHDPLDVYGKTKSLGEVPSNSVLHLRASIIGPEIGRATSLFEWFRNQEKNSTVNGFIDHSWNGVTTEAFGKVCKGIVEQKSFVPGVQHLVPENIVTKAQLLSFFAKKLGRSDIRVNEIESPESIDRTLATLNIERNNEFWKFGGYINPPTIQSMVSEFNL